MSDASNQPEPTMEEILASIRRIISEDTAEHTTTPAAGQPGAEEGDDVLVLTDMVAEDGSVVSLPEAEEEPVEEPQLPAAPDPEPFPLQIEEAAAPMPIEPPKSARRAVQVPDPPPPPPVEEDEGLLSEEAAAVSSAVLAQLTSRLPRGLEPTGSGPGKTVEELVREAVTPMLREWLDANLAIIVERLVRREIERLVRRVEDNV